MSWDKTEWGSQVTVFLGLLINTLLQTVSIPVQKIEKAKELINDILAKKKITVKTLQQICGYLNFLCRAIVLGRAFTTRLYAPMRKGAGKRNQILKQHHHLRVTGEMREDLRMWLSFLESPLAFSRPFIDFNSTLTATVLNWFTDATKNSILGFGGYCGDCWFATQWGDFVTECDPSIEYLELYAVTIAVLLWLKKFKNSRIVLFCDNESAVHMINNQSAKDVNCMVLIRIIVLESLICNSRVFARHVAGSKNQISDSLSRGNFEQFRRLTAHMKMKPEAEEMLSTAYPPQKIWKS